MDNNKIVVLSEIGNDRQIVIRPLDIKVVSSNKLGILKGVSARTAQRLLEFFQDRGVWCSFSTLELFEHNKENASLDNRLLSGLRIGRIANLNAYYETGDILGEPHPHIVEWPNRQHSVTNIFVEECAKESN